MIPPFFQFWGVVWLIGVNSDGKLNSSKGQEAGIYGLLDRIIPGHKDQIKINLQFEDYFAADEGYELSNVNNAICLTANSISAATRGIYDYLRKYYQVHVSWAGNQLKTIPLGKFNPLSYPLKNNAHKKYRYYLNPCTFSYSFTFWNFSRWEKEIDWMALNGINIALAFTGVEAIWIKVFKKIGLSDAEIQDYLPGPAYLAWNRMGNLKSLGGPIPLEWHSISQYNLQIKILERMRSLGILPVLPGFAGHVPYKAFKRIYPNEPISVLSRWGHLNDTYSGIGFLNSSSTLYKEVNKMYLQTLTRHYGTNHVYSIDPFNELKPVFRDDSEPAQVAKSIYDSLIEVDPGAIWLLQSWMFYDSDVWKTAYIKSFLTAIPKGKFLILDLAADMVPLYQYTESFYGQPFIWCVLHNFGGTSGMQGDMPKIQTELFKAYRYRTAHNSSSTCLGSGTTMEGINQNDVIYEFANDLAWSHSESDINIRLWVENYGDRRYGVKSDLLERGWSYLFETVYSFASLGHFVDRHYFPGHGTYTITSMPSLRLGTYVPYEAAKVELACNFFLEKMINQPKLMESDTFKYDLADIVRQMFQIVFESTYHDLVETYNIKFAPKIDILSADMERTFQTLESVLKLSPINLENWLTAANESAASIYSHDNFNESQYETVSKTFRSNALMQITTWAPHFSPSLMDYGKKQWHGMFACYYQPRWYLFVKRLKESLASGTLYNQTDFEAQVWRDVHLQFLYNSTYLDNCLTEAGKGHFPSEWISTTLRKGLNLKHVDDDDVPNDVEKRS